MNKVSRLTQKDEQGNWCLKGLEWEQLHVEQVITQNIWEKLYGALWKLMEYENTGVTPERIEKLNDFEKTQTAHCLAALQEEQRKHRWIPVEERLPDSGNEVLAYIKHNYAEDGWRAYRVYEYTDHWVGMGNLCEVIAWMPLPEPYRPEALREAGAEVAQDAAGPLLQSAT